MHISVKGGHTDSGYLLNPFRVNAIQENLTRIRNTALLQKSHCEEHCDASEEITVHI